MTEDTETEDTVTGTDDTVTESEEATEEREAPTEDVVLDLESAQEYESRIDELQETVEDQRERIEELEGLMLDLSTRVADGKGMGVCPDCHGPVTKITRWIRTSTIECTRCGRVFHEY